MRKHASKGGGYRAACQCEEEHQAQQKFRQRDDQMQGNVHPQEQNAIKARNKYLQENQQASLTAFLGPRQTDKDSGITKMAPLESPVTHPVIEPCVVCCLLPPHWKINAFFLAVLLSYSLSSPCPVLDLVTFVSIRHLHVCNDLVSCSPMRFARRALFLSIPSLQRTVRAVTWWCLAPSMDP